MLNRDSGKSIGVTGLVAILASWLGIWLAPFVLPPPWVPRMWLVTIVIALPSAVIAGVIAGRMASRWWYFLAGAGFVSAAVFLADIAV